MTLLGAVLGSFQGAVWFRALVGLGLGLGFGGVGGLVFGSVSLFQATQLSLINIREEAALIRERQSQRMTRSTNRASGDPGGNTWTLSQEPTRHSRCFFNAAGANTVGRRNADRTR